MIPEDKRRELDEISQTLKDLENECTGHDCYAPVREQVRRALRAIEQFNSGIEVVVCMGMLKAGKSTLVNLLTRSTMASPTGYGQDMTLRPALIRMAEKGAAPRIVLYERAESAAEVDSAELQCVVLDHLRGIVGDDALQNLTMRTLPLTEATLRGVLCHRVTDTPHLTVEPVLVVVEPEYNEECKLLCHRNRMLLDMPGCDSSTAEVARGERYREIGKECDMVLLLQSSVAPLNAKAVEELTALLAGRTPSTTRIIQNRMESKAWLRPEVVDAETHEQSSRALAILRQLAENKEIPVSSVNLGMAHAGIFEEPERLKKKIEIVGGVYRSNDELLAGSGFSELESSLHNELTDIRYQHCCDVLRFALRSLAAATLVTQRGEGKVLSGLRSRLERWTAFEKVAHDALKCVPVPNGAEFSIVPNEMPDFSLVCENIYRDRRELYKGPKASGKDINECMTDCNEACREALHDFLYNLLTDKHIQISTGDEQMSASAWCNRAIRHQLKECKVRLQESDAELWSEFAVPEHPDFHEWQEVHNMPLEPIAAGRENRFNPYIYEERVHRWWWRDGDKQYEVSWGNELFVTQVVDPMVSHYRESADQLVAAQPPREQMMRNITAELQQVSSNFFAALDAKRDSTLTDISQAEQRVAHLAEMVQKVNNLMEFYEKNH